MKKKKKQSQNIFITIIIFLLFFVLNYYKEEIDNFLNNNNNIPSYALSDIPSYNGKPYVIINNNNPNFSEEDLTTKTFEKYSKLDYLGRCGVAYANVSKDTMPTKKRESISSIKPSGWQTTTYDNIDGKYLYNRCHLIAFQLTGQNANEKNLITCTRYANASSMLEFENKVANYIKTTNNHVLYRVTPIFENNNLIATGIQMEALSVEDNGNGIKFNVYIYNIQEGITIDYKTGESKKIN